MAEALLRRRLAALGVDAAVTSAGLVHDDWPASEGSVVAMGRRGLDVAPHRSRVVRREHLAAADLIVAMARVHAREVLVVDPSLLARTFTLKDLVRRGEYAGPRRTGESFDDWLARVGHGRRTVDLLGEDPADDVADPIGQSQDTYDRTADELDRLVDRLVAVAWPTPARHDQAVPQQVERP